jgi:hypothetical protein
MPNDNRAGDRILAAHARHYANMTAEWEAARAAGAPAEELAEIEARVIASRQMYQQLTVDLAHKAPSPWWRFSIGKQHD